MKCDKFIEIGGLKYPTDSVFTQPRHFIPDKQLKRSPSFLFKLESFSGPVGPYSDMWAAGALLFLLLSGQPPFNEVIHLL